MPSDADLVRRARGGDRDAFAALVERHHAALLRTCRRIVGRQAAADAAQDAVVTALLSLDRLRDDDRFGAWLLGIALNVCQTTLRRHLDTRGVRPPYGTWTPRGVRPPYVQGGSDPLTDPADLVVAAEASAQVRAAIAALPRGSARR